VARPNVFSAKYFGARRFSDYVSCLLSGGLCDADKSALSLSVVRAVCAFTPQIAVRWWCWWWW
jgi:hypothetical protein